MVWRENGLACLFEWLVRLDDCVGGTNSCGHSEKQLLDIHCIKIMSLLSLVFL